jgi:hypothetical protein
MFTGFASENTPAIQVWDLFTPMAAGAVSNIYLTDDCAPIQFFKTGSSTLTIKVYLPTAPIEGKTINFINSRFGSSFQEIQLFSADQSGQGTNTNIYSFGAGQILSLTYTKNAISFGTLDGFRRTGWIPLNMGASSAVNHYGVAIGGRNNRVGAFAGVVSGDSSGATGDYSFVGGGQSNTASGSNAAVVGGSSNTASGLVSAAIAGSGNTVSGNFSVVLGGAGHNISVTHSGIVGGSSNTVSNPYSAVIGGDTSNASGNNSVVLGGAFGVTRSIQGNLVSPASINPVAFTVGGSQTATLVLGRQTTDATATRLTSNTSAASTTNQVILPNNSAYYVKGSIIATVTGGGNTKSWDFIATIKRGANAAATSIVGAVTLNVQAADAGASSWIVAITADTTNGGLAVTVTGQAATTIRWVAKLESTEVTY